MRARAALVIAHAVAAALALAAGCSDAEPIDPAPTAAPTQPDGGSADAAPDAPTEPTVKRTVLQRNPFGNVARAENLLWDGDFEWSSPFADQYGWLNYPVDYGFAGIRVGIECRSGLKCAAVADGRGVIGIAVSSKGSKLSASFWARPVGEGATCEGVQAALLSLVDEDPQVAVPQSEDAQDAGWCRFEVVAPERTSKTYLFIENDSGGEVLVDDAVIERAPTSQALSAPAEPPSAAAWQRSTEVKAALRARRGPVDPPPNAARRALEAWAARR